MLMPLLCQVHAFNRSVSFFEQNQEKEREMENQEKKIAEKEAYTVEDGFELVDGTQVHLLYFHKLAIVISALSFIYIFLGVYHSAC